MGLKTGEKIRKKKYDDTLLLWMIPLFCAVAVFYYGPLFGWIYAFFEYQPGKPLTETSFVGLKYFIAMFTSTKDAMNAESSATREKQNRTAIMWHIDPPNTKK